MNHEQLNALSNHFLKAALKLQAGESIWLEFQGDYGRRLASKVADVAKEIGAKVHLVDLSADVMNSVYADMPEEEMIAKGKEDLALMKTMDCYLRIDDNVELKHYDLSSEQMALYQTHVYKEKTDERVRSTRWLVADALTPGFAQANNMDEEQAAEYYMNVNMLDYARMDPLVEPLRKRMAEGRDVHIKGEGTDLTFSIADIPAVPCTGKRNIPDGECYTAPVKESINGTIKYGPSVYAGQAFEMIALTFENGKVIDAVAEDDERTQALNAILDTDEGARYVGEFAIAFNPFILEPMGSILFDEKIAGSIHLALGACYEATENGNKSSIHWDMVHIQRPEHGGGELWIDGELIRKDGEFIVDDLKPLNRENLIAALSPQSGEECDNCTSCGGCANEVLDKLKP